MERGHTGTVCPNLVESSLTQLQRYSKRQLDAIEREKTRRLLSNYHAFCVGLIQPELVDVFPNAANQCPSATLLKRRLVVVPFVETTIASKWSIVRRGITDSAIATGTSVSVAAANWIGDSAARD